MTLEWNSLWYDEFSQTSNRGKRLLESGLFDLINLTLLHYVDYRLEVDKGKSTAVANF